MNDNLETQVKVPAFDDATIAALEAANNPDKEILVQTEEDYEGKVEEPTIH